MSYILEALKKSQAERELGRVPTLDSAGLFEEDRVEPKHAHWGPLAVGLAGAAMLIALYGVIRGPQPQPPGGAQVPLPPAAAGDAAPGAGGHPPTPAAPAPQAPLRASAPPPLAQSVAVRDPGPLPADAAGAPARALPALPLVEPPPPKAGVRAPTPAPRTPAPASAPVVGRAGPDGLGRTQAELDAELERELERQLALEPDVAPEPLPEIAPEPVPTPVPRELIAEIEAFKDQLRHGQGKPAAAAKAVARPADAQAQDPRELRLTPSQQAELPAFLMTVHVYDRDQARRFVLINALKYREGEQTREGLKVERILPDGAVLSFKGNPFYLRR